MADYGLSATGLRIKTAAVVREDINTELRGAWGASYDLSDESPDGILIGITSLVAGSLWALLLALYSGMNRDSATGALLDAILLLTGTLRAEASPSTVTLTLTGTPTTVVPSLSRAKSASVAATTFETTESGTITAVSAWTATTAYNAGDTPDRVTNGGRVYVCIDNGVSAGSGGPIATSDDITDGTVRWRHLGTGTGAIDVAARCTVTGPTVAIAGDVTVIDTPVGGWSSVINILDADLGRDVAADAEARVQGEADLARAGATTKDAIRETLLAVADVESVTVFHNTSDVTDGDGVPPHSVECMVGGGADQDIYDALLASCVAAGIGTHGTETGASEDSEGVAHVVKFSRPDEIEIWVIVNLTKKAYAASDRTSYPIDGDAQVEAAITTFGDAQLCGKNAVASQIGAQAFSVAGVFDVTSTLIGLSNPPAASTTIAIGPREIATYDTSRVSIVASDGTP